MASLVPFTENEIASMGGRWTHYFIIDATRGDLTVSTVSTVQTFTVLTPVLGDWIHDVGFFLTEAFEDTADTGYNDTAITVGDTNDIDNFIVSTQLNKNGTEVYFGYNTGDELPKTITGTIYNVVITMGAQSGKALTSLNKGRVVVLFNIFRIPTGLLTRSTGTEIQGT